MMAHNGRLVRPWYHGPIKVVLDKRVTHNRGVRPGTHLTAREIEVLMLVARGWTMRHIGIELGVSWQTVKNHIGHAAVRLSASNRTEVVMAAIGNGYFQSSDIIEEQGMRTR